MAAKKRLGPRAELMMAGVILAVAVVGWYLALYQPVQAEGARLREKLKAQRDSLAAVERYKAQEELLRERIQQIQQGIDDWDTRFPPRDSIVAIARHLMDFCTQKGLLLTDIEPSLFELYALEGAGAQTAGKHVMQLPIRFKLEGRYIALGKMLEEIDRLPYRLSLADISISSLPDRVPEVGICLDLYLYVHI